MKSTIKKQGVYFLANNHALEMTIAFLNSFRMYNKDLALCLIPYDAKYDKVEALKDIYNFSIFNNSELLAKCDEISLKFHDNIVGAYRKLAIWEGDFDEFIYIDIDTILLDDLSFVWPNLKHCRIFTSHSNSPEIRKWVWKNSIFTKNKLSDFQIEYAANTGFIVSTKNILPMDMILGQIPEALLLKDDMELLCMEQPLLNYLIITSGYNYGSLLVFYIWGGTASKDIKLEYWAGLPGGKLKNGKFVDSHKRPIFLMHWAGVWRNDNGKLDKIPYADLWSYYRNLDPLNLPEPQIKANEKTKKHYRKLLKMLRMEL